jgi:hypothetical protein
MQNKPDRPPILGKFAKRDVSASEPCTTDVVSHTLAISDDDSAGYNPYDKPPPPPTEAQLDAMARRRKLPTRC